jgi:hypothetical protein
MDPRERKRDSAQSVLELEELQHVYALLSAEEPDELLQCLLIGAPRGGEAMIQVLEQSLLCHATEELLEEHESLEIADGN